MPKPVRQRETHSSVHPVSPAGWTTAAERVFAQLRVLRDVARNLVADIDYFEETLLELHERAESRTGTPPESVVDAASRPQILRIADLSRALGLCRSTIYRMMQRDHFPAQVRLSEHAVGWKTSDIDAWLATREASRGVRRGRRA
jgi:prophage regulatory protein